MGSKHEYNSQQDTRHICVTLENINTVIYVGCQLSLHTDECIFRNTTTYRMNAVMKTYLANLKEHGVVGFYIDVIC